MCENTSVNVYTHTPVLSYPPTHYICQGGTGKAIGIATSQQSVQGGIEEERGVCLCAASVPNNRISSGRGRKKESMEEK